MLNKPAKPLCIPVPTAPCMEASPRIYPTVCSPRCSVLSRWQSHVHQPAWNLQSQLALAAGDAHALWPGDARTLGMLVNGEHSQLAFDFVAGHSKGQEQLFRGQTLQPVDKPHELECLQALSHFRPVWNCSAVGTVTRMKVTYARHNCAYPDGSGKLLQLSIALACGMPIASLLWCMHGKSCAARVLRHHTPSAILDQGSVKPCSL